MKTSSESASFKGTFDGASHTISGLNISDSECNNVGLFRYNFGTIKNLNVSGTVTGTCDIVGGIVGTNKGTLDNVTFSGTVTGTNDTVGGLVGDNDAGTVKNSTFIGTLSGNSNVGGLIGNNGAGTITNNKVDAQITGNSNVGALVGVTQQTVTSSDNYFHSNQTAAFGATEYGGEIQGTKVYALNLPENTEVSGALEFGGKYYAQSGSTVTIDGENYQIDGDNYSYIDSDGKIKLTSDYTILDGSQTTLNAGWYVVNSDITISNTLNISGEVHLILADGAKLTVNGGIDSNSYSCKLNIYEQTNQSGELVVTSNSTDAIRVLGGITINGGKITANSPSQGIYTGYDLTINGGKIIDNSSWGIDAYNITLNLKNADDFIQTSCLYVGGTLTVADGKRFYDQNGDVYSGSAQEVRITNCGELKLLDGYVIKVPSGVSITDATQIGSSNAYIFAENANLTLTGFESGEITFDSAITALTKGENSITATTSDGKTFNISVNTSEGSKGWKIDGTNATYSSNFTAAGAYIDGLTIVYQPVEDKTFTISGLKSNLTADELKAGITIDGNSVTVAESLLDTATDGISISDGYTLDLDAPKSKDFSGYGLQTLDNGNVAYLNGAGNTAGWKIIDGVWKYVAASGVKGFELSGVGSIDGISVENGVVTIENENIEEIGLVSNDGGYIFDFTKSYGSNFCGKDIISDGNNYLKLGGTSSSDIFYAITSLDDLQTLHNVTSSEIGTPPKVFTDDLTFKLTADLELDGGNYCICENNGFSGTFDGNGHSISNISDYLIYNNPTGTVKNLLLINVSTYDPFTNVGNYENNYFYTENNSSVYGANQIYKLTLQGVTATGDNVKIFGNDTYAAGEVNFSAKTGYNYAENTAEITSDTTITATFDENNHYVIDNDDGTYQLADKTNTTDYPDLIQVYELTLNGVEVSGGNPITIEGKNYYFGGSTVTFTKKNGYNYNVDSNSITIDSDTTITATLDDTKHYVFDNGNGYTLATAANIGDYPELTQVYELTLQGVTATGDILVTDGGKTYATGEITLAAKTGYNYTGENSATIDNYATFTANFDADTNNHYVLASDTSKLATAADVSDYPDLIKVWKVSGLTLSDNFYTIDGETYVADGAEVTIGNQTFKISADSTFTSTNYVDNGGETQEGYAIPITDATTTINGGWYVVNGTVNLAMLTISGDVHLILADNANLTIQNRDASTVMDYSYYGNCGFGIYGEGATLNIYCQNGGTGTLTANYIRGSDTEGYDISRSFGIYADNINIYGGNVNATSNEGIRSENGDIKVYGGTLTVNGTNDVAISANNVEISGGTVNSTGQDGIYAVDEVKISGGNVNLTGTGCGINANNVNISDGIVIATGNDDSGIWTHGMYDEDDNFIGGNVNISGGTVEATGYHYGIGSSNDVNITGGKVKATCTGEDMPLDPHKGIEANNGKGNINLSWTNADDYVDANSYSGNVTFDKDFWNADGNINQTNGKLYAKSGSIVTLPTGVSIENVPKIDDANKYIVPAGDYTLTLADGVAINGSTSLTVENNNMTPDIYVYYAVTPPNGYEITRCEEYETGGNTYYFGYLFLEPSTGYIGDEITCEITAPYQEINGGTLNLDTENHYVFANGDGYTLADAENVKEANYPALIQVYTVEGTELTAGGDVYCVKDGVAYVKTGGTVTIGGENYEVSADSAYVSYNDGSEQQTLAKILTDDDTSLDSGSYVVNSDLTIDNTLEISGEVNLILADGATLTINNENGEDYAINANGTLNIYGQSAGTGNLEVNGDINSNSAINISGGKVNCWNISVGNEWGSYLNISGGEITVESSIDAYSIHFDGRFYDSDGNIYTDYAESGYIDHEITLKPLGDNFIVTIPDGITIESGTATRIGTTNKYICAADEELTLSTGTNANFAKITGIKGLTAENGTYTYTVNADSTLELEGYPKIDGLTFNSTDDYYEISSVDDFQTLASYVIDNHDCADLTFKQTADIELNNFATINNFAGTFDGNGKLIITPSAIFSGNTGTISGGYYYGTSGNGFTRIYKLNLPSNVEIVGAMNFGGQNYAKDGDKVTISGFNGGEITFDDAITELTTSGDDIIAKGDDLSITISGLTFRTPTDGFNDEKYQRTTTAGAVVGENKISYAAQTVEDLFTLSGVDTSKVTVNENAVNISKDALKGTDITLTPASGQNYSLELASDVPKLNNNLPPTTAAAQVKDKSYIGASFSDYYTLDGNTAKHYAASGGETITTDNENVTGAMIEGAITQSGSLIDGQYKISCNLAVGNDILDKIGYGQTITFSGADITVNFVDNLPADYHTAAWGSANATWNGNTYTAAITTRDYFSNTNGTIKHEYQQGGTTFTISGADTSKVTVDGATVKLSADSFTSDEITLTDGTDAAVSEQIDYKLSIDGLTTAEEAPITAGFSDYSDGKYIYTSAGNKTYYMLDGNKVMRTNQVGGDTFEFGGLNLGTLTIDASGNVTSSELNAIIGTLNGNIFTLNNLDVLGTLSAGATKDFTFNGGGKFTLTLGEEFKLNGNQTLGTGGKLSQKGDAVTGLATYEYISNHDSAYTEQSGNTYTFHAEAAHDEITISNLKAGVTGEYKPDNKVFTLDGNILPDADVTIAISGGYSLSLGDVTKSAYQSDDNGKFENGTLTLPAFKAYYEQSGDSITAHASQAAKNLFTLDGLGNYTTTYSNSVLNIGDIGSVNVSTGAVTFDKAKLESLGTKTYTLDKLGNNITFTINGVDYQSSTPAAQTKWLDLGGGSYSYNSGVVDSYWTNSGNEYKFTAQDIGTAQVTISGLNSEPSAPNNGVITLTENATVSNNTGNYLFDLFDGKTFNGNAKIGSLKFGYDGASFYAVNSAEDFAQISGDGRFKLSADLTLSDAITSDFTGTLEGGGHFVNNFNGTLNGTASNLYYRGAGTISGGTKLYTVNLPEGVTAPP